MLSSKAVVLCTGDVDFWISGLGQGRRRVLGAVGADGATGAAEFTSRAAFVIGVGLAGIDCISCGEWGCR